MVDEEHDDKEIADSRELERALSVLRPAGSQIDRDRFLFLAGRASAEGVRPDSTFKRWVWPAATLMSSVAVVVLSVLLVSRPQPAGSRVDAMSANAGRQDPPVQADVPSVTNQQRTAQSSSQHAVTASELGAGAQTPAVDSDAAPTADETARVLAQDSNYPRLRSFVLAYGINALPEPTPIPQSASDSVGNDEPRTQRELLRQIWKDRSARGSVAGSAG
jgi:hypothetical protein